MLSEKQKVDEILRKHMSLNPEMGFQQSGTLGNDAAADDDDLMQDEAVEGNEERKDASGQAEAQGFENNTTLELDIVNKHECMKNIKRCLDRMQELFSESW